MHFDLVHAADPRFRGGTSSALRTEIKAAARYGLASAILPFAGIKDSPMRSFERRCAALLGELGIPWLTGEEPVECDILLAHHPFVFTQMPLTPARVRPRRVVCVVQHPPFDGVGKPQYDIGKVCRNLERLFGAPATFAPVGPKVRQQFESLLGEKPALTRSDFFNMIDMGEWAPRTRPTPRRTAVIGRHSRTDPLKWPDSRAEVEAVYPDVRHLSLEILGGVPETVKPWIGANWRILPYLDEGVGDFLARLDFYVYFHSRRWVEAFGISIAEAMASGAVTILDPSYETLFEEGAVYAEIPDARGAVENLLAAPERFAKQAEAGRRVAEQKFSLETYPARIAELYDDLGLASPAALAKRRASGQGPPPTRAPLPGEAATKACRPFGRRRRVLFVATNGLGLGHVTRLMAIAERMSADLEPAFLTMSAGTALIHARGHAADYLPSAEKAGVSEESWNRAFAQELLAAVEAFDVSAVAFDSHHPYPGLLSVASARPDVAWVWMRRGMWAPHHRIDPTLGRFFDLIVEPGELAADEDSGVTTTLSGHTVPVPPILLADPADRLSRGEAAARLGVDPAGRIAVMQLGSQRNFDVADLRRRLVAGLGERGVQVVEILNPLAMPPSGNDGPAGTVACRAYPLAPLFDAVDLMVTNAGYNSFHECVFGAVPTIFVPNEARVMDDQIVRAAYARSCGLAFCLRATELAQVAGTLDAALSDGFRIELQERAARLERVNGAAAAAAAIEELVFSVRTDRPLSASVPRV